MTLMLICQLFRDLVLLLHVEINNLTHEQNSHVETQSPITVSIQLKGFHISYHAYFFMETKAWLLSLSKNGGFEVNQILSIFIFLLWLSYMYIYTCTHTYEFDFTSETILGEVRIRSIRILIGLGCDMVYALLDSWNICLLTPSLFSSVWFFCFLIGCLRWMEYPFFVHLKSLN